MKFYLSSVLTIAWVPLWKRGNVVIFQPVERSARVKSWKFLYRLYCSHTHEYFIPEVNPGQDNHNMVKRNICFHTALLENQILWNLVFYEGFFHMDRSRYLKCCVFHIRVIFLSSVAKECEKYALRIEIAPNSGIGAIDKVYPKKGLLLSPILFYSGPGP